MVRLAVVGAGAHSSSTHGPALKQFVAEHPGRAELCAVCDLDARKAAEYAASFGFARAYGDIDAMIRAECLDGLIAVTPLRLNYAMGLQLLEKGIPVMLEKPPGETANQARALLALATGRQAPHVLSFNRRANPALQTARAWLSEHAADRPPQLLLARMRRHARREADFVLGTGVHLIDAALSFLPAPERVSTARLPGSVPDCFLFESRVTCGRGAVAHLSIAPQAGRTEETYEIIGRDYSIMADTACCACDIRDRERQVVAWRASDEASAVFRDGSLGEVESFVGCIEEGVPFGPDLRDGLRDMQVAEAIQAGGDVELGSAAG